MMDPSMTPNPSLYDRHEDCSVCRAIEGGGFSPTSMQNWELECLHRSGFFMHGVQGDDQTPLDFNLHTHGLEVTLDHSDLQIVFPLDGQTGAAIMHRAVDKIRAALKFSDGDEVFEVIGNGLPVKFVRAMESGREILRCILPDKYGNLDPQSMEEPFNRQYDMLGLP